MKTNIPVYVGQDAVGRLVRYCAERQASRFTLVADENTYAVLGRSVESALTRRGWDVFPVVLGGQEIGADDYQIVQVLARAPSDERTYVAVGSGTVTDITRFVSHRTRSPFISVPTAPSVDGYASGSSSLALGGLKQTVRARPPVAIYADLPTLAAAPRAMIAAGFGDMLGKFTAAADWRLGHLLWDEPYDEAIAQRALGAVRACADHVAEIGQASPEGIRHLMSGLVETGLCMLDAGYSAPASGAEHYLSHFWETKLLREGRPAIFHGAKVGVGTVLVAGYYDQVKRLSREDAAERLAASALPDRDQEIRRIRDAFGPISDQVIAQHAPFLDLTSQAFEALKRKIVENWAVIQELAALVPSAADLAGLLDKVGGPTTAAALGLRQGEDELALHVAHYFRNRFTAIKLGRMLGMIRDAHQASCISKESYMHDKLADYKRAAKAVAGPNELWPLYGVGLENLGRDGKPITVPLPAFGPDELLVRHDACGLCPSDIKVIGLGDKHPRIYRDLKQEPAVLGHEVTMTVVGVGENLRGQYRIGDRFIIQSDIFVGGTGYAYGYMIQGGLSKYAVIDQRILNGDDGNYLIPVKPETGYAESALTEPWACVIAAYQLEYRTALKKGGTTWIIGTGGGSRDYSLSYGFDERSAPARLLLTNVPEPFAHRLKLRAKELGVAVVDVADIQAQADSVDDIVLLGADPDVFEAVCPRLAHFGILAIMAEAAPSRPVNVDIGRIHYDRWLCVGSTGTDIAAAYRDVPARSTLRPGGRAWFVGAGGPMGKMHVQRAIQLAQGPRTILCTDVSDMRLQDLRSTFADEARARGVEFVCLNPTRGEEYRAAMQAFREQGFDDIVVLAPIPAVIADAETWLAPRGIMNIFAGVARGTMARLPVGDVYLKNIRIFGHSASSIADLRLMLHQAESGELSPNRSVAAVGSLGAARDGLRAVKDATLPGKVVIFPQIKEMPLTPLAELKDKLPTVFAKLKNGREWTVEAEREFLAIMLED